MAFDENLVVRIRHALARKINIEEERMFGGIGFLLNGNLRVGVRKNRLVSDSARNRPHKATPHHEFLRPMPPMR